MLTVQIASPQKAIIAKCKVKLSTQHLNPLILKTLIAF
jgi:hypothetical protein